MRGKVTLCAAVFMAAMLTTPATALEYTFEALVPGDFGAATSQSTVYVTDQSGNMDRSKNTALVPPDFGTPTSYFPGSGEPLTSNLAGDMRAVAITTPGGGVVQFPNGLGVSATPGPGYPTTAYTAVTSDLYYSDGHLATLKIPSLGVSVKVYEGTDSTQLAKGAGHFPDSSIWDGNVAIAGHNRGVNCYFGNIHTLALGNRITLTTKLGTRTYAVASVTKVNEMDSSMLAATADNRLTLYTCVRNQAEYRWCVQAVEI